MTQRIRIRGEQSSFLRKSLAHRFDVGGASLGARQRVSSSRGGSFSFLREAYPLLQVRLPFGQALLDLGMFLHPNPPALFFQVINPDLKRELRFFDLYEVLLQGFVLPVQPFFFIRNPLKLRGGGHLGVAQQVRVAGVRCRVRRGGGVRHRMLRHHQRVTQHLLFQRFARVDELVFFVQHHLKRFFAGFDLRNQFFDVRVAVCFLELWPEQHHGLHTRHELAFVENRSGELHHARGFLPRHRQGQGSVVSPEIFRGHATAAQAVQSPLEARELRRAAGRVYVVRVVFGKRVPGRRAREPHAHGVDVLVPSHGARLKLVRVLTKTRKSP
mmetsp:Transcript_4087/g.15018  ORF Transcript_4087/g.15018 Transcript_4087/m.15018 type:complete len:328 (-) Transcript_4087:139-1122(-)